MLAILINRNEDEVTLRCRGSIVAGQPVHVLRFATEMRHELIIILDLLQVRTIDAAGLGLLVELHHSLKSDGRELRLSRVPARVRRTLRLVNLHHLLNVTDWHAMAA